MVSVDGTEGVSFSAFGSADCDFCCCTLSIQRGG